jgi:hypothetical protein
MGEAIRTALMCAAMVAGLQVLKWIFGPGVSLTVAVAMFSFCIGALWAAGDKKRRDASIEKGDPAHD